MVMSNSQEISKYFTEHAIEQMRVNGITLEKLGSRLAHGVPIDEVFSFKTRGRKSPLPEAMYAKAKENRISRQLLHDRIRNQGMSLEEAVTKPVGRWVDKTVI